MYNYDDKEYEGTQVVYKTGEEGNVLLMQAEMNTSVPTVKSAVQEYMKENRNKNGEPYSKAVVGLLFSSIEVPNHEYEKMKAETKSDGGREL